MSDDIIDLMEMLKERHRFVLKRYEMSKATLQHLEHQLSDKLMDLKPEDQRATALWGIPIYIDNKMPFGEIKPVYG